MATTGKPDRQVDKDAEELKNWIQYFQEYKMVQHLENLTFSL